MKFPESSSKPTHYDHSKHALQTKGPAIFIHNSQHSSPLTPKFESLLLRIPQFCATYTAYKVRNSDVRTTCSPDTQSSRGSVWRHRGRGSARRGNKGREECALQQVFVDAALVSGDPESPDTSLRIWPLQRSTAPVKKRERAILS